MARKWFEALARQVSWYSFRAQTEDESVAELRIYGPIGESFFDEESPSARRVVGELDALSEQVRTIRVSINSPGGNPFDAIHIYNALIRQQSEHGRTVEVEIEALAASAATLVSSAGSVIRMPENALFMIHNPSGGAVGEADTMRRVAAALEKIKNAMVATYRGVTSLSERRDFESPYGRGNLDERG